MKALKNPLFLTIIALLLSSFFTSRSAYSQGEYYDDYDADYGYYDDSYNNNSGISFNVFYNELRPHGRWINDRNYGRVWIPNVGNNFHPYATNGYWAMTDYGNTWVSDYSWGWAPFHYGRWFHDDYYGWAWIPGYEWAPAWVSWRSGGGYYGWAPMGPRVNINIHVNVPSIFWTFLPNRYMYHRNMHRYYNRYSPHIYNRTTIINNTYVYNDSRYYSGPSASDYQRETGRKATVRRLESTNNRSGRSTRVSNNAVSVYRPEVSRERSANSRATVNERAASTRSDVNNRSATTRSNANSRAATTRSIGNENTRSNNQRATTVTPANSESRASRSAVERSTTTREQNVKRNATEATTGNNRNATVKSQSTTRNTTVSPQRSTTNNRNAAVRSQSTTKNNTRSATVSPQRSATSNRSATVRSQSTARSSNRSATSSSSRTQNARTERSSGRR